MASAFPRLSRVLGAVAILATLAACVPNHHRGYHGGGGYGRNFSQHQPVFRGGWNGGGWQGGGRQGGGGQHRGWR